MKILLLNAGSSSLKAALVDANGTTFAQGLAEWSSPATHYKYAPANGAQVSEEVPWKGHSEAVQRFVSDLMHIEPALLTDRSPLAAVGHRVVHGGRFTSAVRISPAIRAEILALADLAPLHNPPSLETLAAAERALPDVPQVAVFDTAFHSTLSEVARTYPVPARWTHEWGIRRYGFHGLSHAYCSRRAAELLGLPSAELKLVVCHLGHGCSATAIRGGQSIDTTMGFTPLDGLMMATRSGAIDPAIVLHVEQHHALTAQQVDIALNRESGLLGVSGISGDMRQLLAADRDGHKQARLALKIYAHRVRQAIGGLAVTLDGVAAVVFTGGVGEHAAEIRESICTGMACLGLELDAEANARCTPDADVATRSSRGRILVVSTREDLTMLKEVVEVISGQST